MRFMQSVSRNWRIAAYGIAANNAPCMRVMASVARSLAPRPTINRIHVQSIARPVDQLLHHRLDAPSFGFDGVEIGIALHQQPQIAAQYITFAHAAFDRQRLVDPSEHWRQPIQVVSHQCQAGYRREAVVGLLVNDRAHRRIVSARLPIGKRCTRWVSACPGRVTDSGAF